MYLINKRGEKETTTKEELRQLFVKNSKEVKCPRCGGIWAILKWRRRPAKRLLPRKCPYCNPLGIRIIKHEVK